MCSHDTPKAVGGLQQRVKELICVIEKQVGDLTKKWYTKLTAKKSRWKEGDTSANHSLSHPDHNMKGKIL